MNGLHPGGRLAPMTPVLAHLGHWYEVTPYVGPVLLIAGWVAFQSWRFRGEEDE